MTIRALITAGLGLACISALAQGDGASWEGKKMPAFKMASTTGKTLTNASLKGKVYLVDFWATWCGPCKAGMPMMQRLHTKYGRKGFTVIGADVFEHANADTAGAQYAKANNLTYTFTKKNDKLAQAMGVNGIPAVFLVDKKGVVRKAVVGFDSSGGEEKTLNAEVQKLLAEK